MGFSVLQPALGAALQFFPAMGSRQLDEMIDAYIPGSASILDKRTAVSLEFFEHTMQTGELFKFFLVYSNVNSNAASPASTMQDSGYASSFNTSPILAESQWTQMTSASFDSTSTKANASAKKAKSSSSRTQAGDFSHIPGMKIMTKDGLDVTNAASRGCKTREQRDHAHLMRIIKACDACKRKKTRCDPSHKKRGSSAAVSPEPKVSKKVRRRAAPPPAQKSPAASACITFDNTFDFIIPDSFSFNTDFTAAPDLAMQDWDQYIKYDEEVNDVIPQDYDFFFDPAGYFSPTATTDSFNSASVSPSRVLTPGQSQPGTPASGVEYAGSSLLGAGDSQRPTLPYLSEDGLEGGNNYVDFALYSPGSECLDDDLKDVAAPQGPGSSKGQQLSSRRRLGARSTPRSELADTVQDNAIQIQNSLDHNAFALESTSSFVQEGLVQSDQVYYDPGNDREQRSQRSSSLAPAVSAYTGALTSPAEPRVPSMTVSPSDTLLGPRPRLGPDLPLVGYGNTDLASLTTDGVRQKYPVQPLTATGAEQSQLVTVSDIGGRLDDSELSVWQASRPSSQGRTTVEPFATSTAVVPGTPTPQESPYIESQGLGSVLQRRLPAGLRHQRRPDELQSGKAGLVAMHADSVDSVQQASSIANAFTNGLASGQSDTVAGDSNSQESVASHSKTSFTIGTGLVQSQSIVVQTTVAPLPGFFQGVVQAMTSPHTGLAQGAVRTTSSPLTGLSSGITAGLLPVNGLLAVSVALGLRSASPSSVGAFGKTTAGLLPVLAVLSSFVALAFILCQGLSQMVLSPDKNSQSIVSATLVALAFVAGSTGTQQYSVSCMDKLNPFMQALHFARKTAGDVINNVKSQIQGLPCGIVSIQRITALARASRPLDRNNVTRVAMVY